jgi:protein gp37
VSDNSKIEWTDATWNPVTGCTKVSPGCDHCYAETFAERFRGVPGHHFEHGFDVQLRPDRLDQPFRWKRPRRVFVNSMSDLFHDQVPDEYIAKVWAVMAMSRGHTFQVLTKRPGRMRSLLKRPTWARTVGAAATDIVGGVDCWTPGHPLANVWLGVSAEDQKWADVRIPVLLDTPAAVRFVSAEPLLGPIDLGESVFGPVGLDWVIVGGESGHGARPMHPNWARSLRAQCVCAGVAFHFKQWGEYVSFTEAPGTPKGAPKPSHDFGDGWYAQRVGKGLAGRELDGRTWDELPALAAAV